MFAVIKTGGKQYRVAAEDTLNIERVAGEVGDIVEIGNVLAFGEGDKVTIGTPFVDGAMVTAEVIEQGRGPKVIAFKKRRRQNSRRKRGHRQLLTTVRISEILTGGAKPSKAALRRRKRLLLHRRRPPRPKPPRRPPLHRSSRLPPAKPTT